MVNSQTTCSGMRVNVIGVGSRAVFDGNRSSRADNIFDEISGAYIDAILSMIKRLKTQNTTLILATTRPEIADKICRRKVFFENGCVVDD